MGNITVTDTGSVTESGQGGQTLILGTPTDGSFVDVKVNAAGGVMIEVAPGWTGTLNFEQSPNGAVSAVALDAVVLGVNTVLQSITSPGIFKANIAGATDVRVRASGSWTGTAQVKITPCQPVDLTHVALVGNSPNAQPIQVSVVSGTSGGQSVFSAQGLYTGSAGKALVSSSPVTIKSSAGTLSSLITNKNTNANDCFVLLYNTTSPTVGTTVPLTTIPVPSGGYYALQLSEVVEFSTAISVAIVMTSAVGSLAPTTPFGIDVYYD